MEDEELREEQQQQPEQSVDELKALIEALSSQQAELVSQLKAAEKEEGIVQDTVADWDGYFKEFIK